LKVKVDVNNRSGAGRTQSARTLPGFARKIRMRLRRKIPSGGRDKLPPAPSAAALSSTEENRR